MITPAELNQRITIQRAAYADDGMGGKKFTGWSELAVVWAKVTGRSGEERFIADVGTAVVNYRLTIWFRADVLPKDRILWRGKTLAITAAYDADGDRRWLTIDAQEKSGGG